MLKSGRLLTLAGFISFFIFGFVDNLKGPILPELLRGEGLTYSQGGGVFLGAYVGFIIATLLTGIMADVMGNRGVLGLSGILLSGGLVGLHVASSYSLLVVMMFIIGLGLGAIEVGANGLMLELHPSKPGRYLNLLATFHGVGSLLVPLYVAGLIGLGFTWRQIYSSAAILSIALIALCVRTSQGEQPQTRIRSEWNGRAVLSVGFTQQMCWFYALIATYVAAELGLAAWLVEYLQTVHGLSVGRSSLYLSGFFFLLMLGRLLGSFLVDRIGHATAIAAGLLGGIICLCMGLFGPQWIISLSVCGLFLSIVFPTATAAVAQLHQEHRGSIMGLLFTFGGLGGAMGPWIIGIVSDHTGLRVGLAATMAFSILSMVALGVLVTMDSRLSRVLPRRSPE